MAVILAQTMTATDWAVWICYELVVALAVVGKTVAWLGPHFRVTRAGLESWVGLLVLAFFCAIALGQWRGTSFLPALIAFGLASGMIVSAAVNAAYGLGLTDGRGISDREA